MLATFQNVQIVSVMKRQKKSILVRGEQMLRNLKQNLIPNPKGHWVPIVSSQGWFALTRSVPPPLPLTEDAKKRRHCGGNHWSKVWGGVQLVQVVTLRWKFCERTKVQGILEAQLSIHWRQIWHIRPTGSLGPWESILPEIMSVGIYSGTISRTKDTGKTHIATLQ